MTTKADLQQTIDRINRKREPKITLDFAYGKVLVLSAFGRDLSPRLTKRELALWLSGFEEAIDEMQRS